MKLLSISISSGSKSSNTRDSKRDSANNTRADDRVSSEQLCTLLIGGLHSELGEDVCSKMVSKEIIALCHCTPMKIDSKGQFKCILWAKFESIIIRDRVEEFLRKHNDMFWGATIWCAADLPLAMRVERKFLFSLKRLLMSRAWQPFEINVDIDSACLQIANHDIMTIHAYDQKCNIVFAHGWDQRFAIQSLSSWSKIASHK